jgi:hypothetical protein
MVGRRKRSMGNDSGDSRSSVVETARAESRRKSRGESVFPYDTIIGKSEAEVERELDQLQRATRTTVDTGCEWLLRQIHPRGPIMGERNMAFVYKPLWALAATGHTEAARRILDWLELNAVQANGDVFFPDEAGLLRDGSRLYRAVTVLRSACLLSHSLARNEGVRTRLHQYQDPATGGVYSYIGEDSARPDFPERCNVLECAFFGEYALASDSLDAALACGQWLASLVDQNRAFMEEQGRFYWHALRNGTVDTDVGAGEEYGKVLTTRPARQMNYPGWVTGCCIAFLADLYTALRAKWSMSEDECRPYLELALTLADYEAQMPLETYHFPSKCKVAWGAGSLLSALVESGSDSEKSYDDAYRIGKRTYLYTFLGTRLESGAWGAEFYPLSTDAPELAFDYRTMEGISTVASQEPSVEPETSVVLPAIEITGENVAELSYLAAGVRKFARMRADRREAADSRRVTAGV